MVDDENGAVPKDLTMVDDKNAAVKKLQKTSPRLIVQLDAEGSVRSFAG